MRSSNHNKQKFFSLLRKKNISIPPSSADEIVATPVTPEKEAASPVVPQQEVAVPVVNNKPEQAIYDELLSGKYTEEQRHSYLRNIGKDDEGATVLSKVRAKALAEYMADESEHTANIHSRWGIFKAVNSADNQAQIAKTSRAREPEIKPFGH